MDNPYNGIPMVKEMADRIRQSFQPGWEDRYSSGYSDGWYYIYRTGSEICRFRLEELADGMTYITDTQRCRDTATAFMALRSFVYTIVHRWKKVTG